MSLYRDCWLCVLRHLFSLEEILACSFVSKQFHQICRMDILYQRWIDRYTVRLKGCPNPFIKFPLWKQFLCLAGQYSSEWYQWYRGQTEYKFIYAMLYLSDCLDRPMFLPASCIIVNNITGKVWLFQERGHIRISGFRDPLMFSPSRLKEITKYIMQQRQ